MRKLLFNILLKRGATTLEETIGKAVRHGMTTYGGVLMTQGLADSNDVTALSGGAVALAGMVLSLARTWVQKRYG